MPQDSIPITLAPTSGHSHNCPCIDIGHSSPGGQAGDWTFWTGFDRIVRGAKPDQAYLGPYGRLLEGVECTDYFARADGDIG